MHELHESLLFFVDVIRSGRHACPARLEVRNITGRAAVLQRSAKGREARPVTVLSAAGLLSLGSMAHGGSGVWLRGVARKTLGLNLSVAASSSRLWICHVSLDVGKVGLLRCSCRGRVALAPTRVSEHRDLHV